MGERKKEGGGQQGRRREGEYSHTTHEDNKVSLSSSPNGPEELIICVHSYTLHTHRSRCDLPRAVLLTQKLLHIYPTQDKTIVYP